MEEYSDGVSMKYAYASRHKLSAEVSVIKQEEKEKLFYHTDRLGSSVFVSDVNGEVKAVTNFDEWGNRDKYDIVKREVGNPLTLVSYGYATSFIPDVNINTLQTLFYNKASSKGDFDDAMKKLQKRIPNNDDIKTNYKILTGN